MGKDKDQAWTVAMQKAYEDLFGPPVQKRRGFIQHPVFEKNREPKCPQCGGRPQFVEMTARVRCRIDDEGDGEHALLGKTDHVGKRLGPIHFVCRCGNSWKDANTSEEGRVADSTIFEAWEYMAWCLRCMFQDEFRKKFEEYGKAHLGWDDSFAIYMSMNAWEYVTKKGVLETFQANITDKDFCKAFAHAFNVHSTASDGVDD